MKISYSLISGLALLGGIGQSAHAANITWSSATGNPITGDGDVVTAGTLVNATNIDGGNVTVNTVPFTAASGGTITQGNLTISVTSGLSDAGGAYGSGNAPFNTYSGNYQNLIGTGDYQDSGNTESIQYTGLTIGHSYEFQFFVNDSRTCCGNNTRNETLTAGNSTTLTYYNATGADGQVGQYALGNFVADATNQLISVNSASGNLQNNGLQLRDLTPVPEPGTLVLLGLAAVGLFAVAARRRTA